MRANSHDSPPRPELLDWNTQRCIRPRAGSGSQLDKCAKKVLRHPAGANLLIRLEVGNLAGHSPSRCGCAHKDVGVFRRSLCIRPCLYSFVLCLSITIRTQWVYHFLAVTSKKGKFEHPQCPSTYTGTLEKEEKKQRVKNKTKKKTENPPLRHLGPGPTPIVSPAITPHYCSPEGPVRGNPRRSLPADGGVALPDFFS